MDSVIDVNILNNIDVLTNEQFNTIKNKIEKNLVAQTNIKPLFRHQLTPEEWKIVEEYAQKLNEDYNYRIKIMLKRLEVTFESFLWSDRIKKFENKIMEHYALLKEQFLAIKPIEVDDLIAASTDLLIVDKTSSRYLRETTSNEFSTFTVKDKPMDRGGRTTEMIAPPSDAPLWKQQKQLSDQSSGNRNNGSFFNQYRNQRNNHIENQIRQQYQNDSKNDEDYLGNNNRGGGYRGGRGGGYRGGRGGSYEKRKRNN